MTKTINPMLHGAIGALLRVMLIFIGLTVFTDAMTRLYYSYMPINHWISLHSVTVKTINGEPTVVIERDTKGPLVSVFHRTLFVLYPEITRACTASVVAVLDQNSDRVISIPLERVLSPNCPSIIGDRRLEGTLQVSYIFDFPYGVKRTATKYSNPFAVSYNSGKYIVGPARVR